MCPLQVCGWRSRVSGHERILVVYRQSSSVLYCTTDSSEPIYVPLQVINHLSTWARSISAILVGSCVPSRTSYLVFRILCAIRSRRSLLSSRPSSARIPFADRQLPCVRLAHNHLGAYTCSYFGGCASTFLPPTSPQSVLNTVPPDSVNDFIIALLPSGGKSP